MGEVTRVIETILEPPAGGHRCLDHLPQNNSGYGSTGYPNGTCARCWCGRWWFTIPFYGSFGPTSVWKPVRWYNRRAKAMIEQWNAQHREMS